MGNLPALVGEWTPWGKYAAMVSTGTNNPC